MKNRSLVKFAFDSLMGTIMDKATEFCNYSDLLSSVKSLEYGDVLLILGDNHMGKTWFRNKMCEARRKRDQVPRTNPHICRKDFLFFQ